MNSKALSVLAEAGIAGAEAEIALRRLLSALAAQTQEVHSLLEALGLRAEDVDPAHERTVDIVRRLSRAGLNPSAAESAFGSRGAAAYGALADNLERFEQLEA